MKTLLSLVCFLYLSVIVHSATWPTLSYGDVGRNVFALGDLLAYQGYITTREGRYDQNTVNGVMSFQTSRSITSDGIAGPTTLSNVCPLISSGASGDHVRGLERLLQKNGYSATINGVYSTTEVNLVKSFQTSKGLTSDGIVGPNTWRELFGNNNKYPEPTVEFRAAWVSTVSNIDWPSSSSLTVAVQQSQMITLLNLAVSMRMNAIIFQVRPEGDAFYVSNVGEPWSRFLTGTQAKAPSPAYDPLTFVITEAKKRGLEVHAWFNPYRAASNANINVTSSHMCSLYPTYCYRYGSALWMDPGASIVQNRTYNVVMDVVSRYNISGVHFDDYFYPYPIAGTPFPDSATYQSYVSGGGKLTLANWRRNNVNTLVQRLYNGIHALKPKVKFGISPFGIYRNGVPTGIVGLDQYDEIYADPKLWLQSGWVDYLSPQLYWRIDPPEQSYLVLLDYWTSINTLNRHIYVGNYLSLLNTSSTWTLDEFRRQIEISRSYSSTADGLSLGNIMFSFKPFLEDRIGVVNYFKTLYTQNATVPVMSWL